MATEVLPPMPASDETSMSRNAQNHYYGEKSADFWAGAQVIRIEDEPPKQCDHYFERNEKGEVVCKKCHFGFVANFEIQDGQLLERGEPVRI